MLKKQDAQIALTAISITAIVFGVLYALLGVGLLALLGVSHATGELSVVVSIFLAIAALALLTATALILGGVGGLKKQRWCRVPLLVGAAVSLTSFPIGTIFAGFTIWLIGFDETVKSLLK